jgi:AcrR family transcriptional regulator
MARNKMSEQTRSKLLSAAREVFLEKGYEKAKVEDIALRAGVNKVMVYYHYDSKENIIRELIYSIIQKAKSDFGEGVSILNKTGLISQDMIIKKVKTVLGGNIELIRLIAVEVLKGNIDIRIILDLLGDLYKVLVFGKDKDKMEIPNWDELFIKMLFFQGFPIILFFLLSEEVSEKTGMNKEKIEQVFSLKFAETMTATLKSMEKMNKQEAL